MFAGAAYRLHHLVNDEIAMPDGEIGSLADHFFSPHSYLTLGMSTGWVDRLIQQKSHRFGAHFSNTLQHALFCNGDECQDLAARNCMRGIELDLPLYNEARELHGLPPRTDFSWSTCEGNLEDIYDGDIDSVELFMGGSCESPEDNAVLGETFLTIVKEQFLRLRDHDPNWIQDEAPEGRTYREVIRLTTNANVGLLDTTDVFQYVPNVCGNGYTVVYEGGSTTCNRNHRISQVCSEGSPCSIEDCKTFCDSDESCKFFGRHDQGQCHLYSSCRTTRNDANGGFTCQRERCFRQISNTNCFNYGRITKDGYRGNDVTLEQCQMLCQDEVECVKINYYKSGVCTNCGVPSRCYLLPADNSCTWLSANNVDTYEKMDCGVCPAGYEAISQNLDGAGKQWSPVDTGRSIDDCATICDNRAGCTGFEYAEGPTHHGGCGTYTGGNGNIYGNENRLASGSNWRSCMKID